MNPTTTTLGYIKFGVSGLCAIAGIVFAATGNVPVSLALFAIAGQGGLSGLIGVKSADATKP